MKEIQLEYSQSKDGRTVDSEALGLRGIVQLGLSRFLRSRVPTAEHIHRGMLEIGFCLRSPLSLRVQDRELPVMPGVFFVNQPNVPHVSQRSSSRFATTRSAPSPSTISPTRPRSPRRTSSTSSAR